MAKNNKIVDLLKVNANNKRLADDFINQILANICFEIMEDISNQVYKTKTHQDEYNSFCGVIFKRISSAIRQAHLCDTYDEFIVSIEDPVVYVSDIVSKIAKKNISVNIKTDKPELLKEFRKVNKEVYKRFFTRKRKVRKNVKCEKR